MGRSGTGRLLGWGARPVARRSGLLFAASLVLGACGSILDPDPFPAGLPGIIDGPAQAALMVVEARWDFECAYSNFVYNTAHLSGELMGAGAAILDRPLATRNVLPHHEGYGRAGCEVEVGLFVPLSGAVASSEAALRALGEATDAALEGRRGLMGEAALLAGFSYAAFGEAFCQASFNGGAPISPIQLFSLAEDRFTIAATMAELAGDLDTFLAALVGRARVRLPQGKRAEAVGDARRVPRDFHYEVERSNDSPGEQNDVFVANAQMGTASVDPHYWDVQWMGVPDPRVALRDVGAKGTNGVTPLVVHQKYTWGGSAIRLASWVEAQLIIAEVEGGREAVEIINELHYAAGLPLFVPSDEASVLPQVLEERRREFFLEGRRMGDLRRLGGFPLWNGAGTVDSWTFYPFGGTECFPLPQDVSGS